MTPEQFEFIKYTILGTFVFQILVMLILGAGIDDLKKRIDELKRDRK